MKILITCSICKKDRLVETNGMLKSTYEKQSQHCHKCGFNKKCLRTSFQKGSIPWNKGNIKLTFEGKSYDGIHGWVERILGFAKDGVCQKCGSSNNLQWSNKSAEYKLDINDWQRLCVKCHHRYDYEKFGARKEFYT